MGKPFVINRHGRLVFPSNFLVDLDFSAIETEEQLSAVVRRDFEAKAPDGRGHHGQGRRPAATATRFQLLRDLALNLFWANRYAMTMYDKRPTRWRDVPRTARRHLPAEPARRGGTASSRSRPSPPAIRRCPPRSTRRPRTASTLCSSTSTATSCTTRRSCSAIKLTVQEVLAADDLAPHLLPVVATSPTTRFRLRRDPRLLGGAARSSRRSCAWRWSCTTSIRGTAGMRLKALREDRRRRVRGGVLPAQPRGERVHPPRAHRGPPGPAAALQGAEKATRPPRRCRR